MINFTVGPVQSSEEILSLGAEQVPYFRTKEFSELILENERMIKQLTHAGSGARAVFVTGSGTAGMEATVMNLLTSNDHVLIINGGTFGQRFVELCGIHNLNYEEIKLEYGQELKYEELKKYDKKGYTALLVNHLETSTGILYDINMLGEFCTRNRMLFIVDAISSFLAEEINMSRINADILITGSQKALACPPGIAIIVMSERAVHKINKNTIKSMYFNLKSSLKDGERGQTPFTPAVSILIQLNSRLNKLCIEEMGERERKKIKGLADDFRKRIVKYPFKVASHTISNTVTPIEPLNISAYDVFLKLKEEYGIWVCPNGGELKDRIFRVGHIGELSLEDNDILINAIDRMYKKGEI